MKAFILFFLFIPLLFAQYNMKKLYVKSRTKTYKPLTQREYWSAVSLFKSLLKAPVLNETLSKEINQLHLELVKLKKNTYAITDTQREGGGFYIIRYKKVSKSMISIPHRFHDLKTGNIGYKLMRESSYRAAAFNTVHRKTMDAAHTEFTLFNAFHLAFAKTYPQESIYQLHGFSNTKRSTLAAQDAHIIVSSSSRYLTAAAQKVYSCLNKESGKCLLYGKNIFELGGTKNIQSMSLRDEGYRNFVHIELNSLMRDKLKKDAGLRARIAGCMP